MPSQHLFSPLSPSRLSLSNPRPPKRPHSSPRSPACTRSARPQRTPSPHTAGAAAHRLHCSTAAQSRRAAVSAWRRRRRMQTQAPPLPRCTQRMRHSRGTRMRCADRINMLTALPPPPHFPIAPPKALPWAQGPLPLPGAACGSGASADERSSRRPECHRPGRALDPGGRPAIVAEPRCCSCAYSEGMCTALPLTARSASGSEVRVDAAIWQRCPACSCKAQWCLLLSPRAHACCAGAVGHRAAASACPQRAAKVPRHGLLAAIR